MSYDIEAKVRVEASDVWVAVDAVFDCCNITWNVREIITRSTGLDWKNEEDNGLVQDIIPKIAVGLAELMAHKEAYKQYEPDNGYGTVDGVIKFFTKLINQWNDYCSYSYNEKLIPYLHFWIC